MWDQIEDLFVKGASVYKDIVGAKNAPATTQAQYAGQAQLQEAVSQKYLYIAGGLLVGALVLRWAKII